MFKQKQIQGKENLTKMKKEDQFSPEEKMKIMFFLGIAIGLLIWLIVVRVQIYEESKGQQQLREMRWDDAAHNVLDGGGAANENLYWKVKQLEEQQAAIVAALDKRGIK